MALAIKASNMTRLLSQWQRLARDNYAKFSVRVTGAPRTREKAAITCPRRLLTMPTSTQHLLGCESLYFIQTRDYAKGKSKGGKKKGKSSSAGKLSIDELNEIFEFDEFADKLDQVIVQLQGSFQQQLSVRTNLSTFDELVIQTEDGTFPLIKIGRVSMKNPSLMVIDMIANPKYIKDVSKALEKSGMNLNPQQDKTSIFVPVPKVTREHRERLVKNAKTLCNKSKDQLKDIQNKYVRIIKNEEGGHSKSLIQDLTQTVQGHAHDYMAKVDEMLKVKSEELLSGK